MNRNYEKIVTGLVALSVVVMGMMWVPLRGGDKPISFRQITKVDYFKDLTIEAKSAYVFDLAENKVLYAKNENAPFPIASITKIMTAVTASELGPRSTIVNITPESILTEGDTGLRVNESWSLVSLLKYTLVVSSNDGAAAVARAFGDSNTSFIDKMNAKAESLGLRNTKFYNESGLDLDSKNAGAYSSASDVAKFFTYALKTNPDIIEPTRYSEIQIRSLDKIVHTAKNTDILAEKIPGLIAGKTGFSDLAGGNLVVAWNVGLQHPIIMVVLGSSYDGRFTDVEKLVNATLESII